MWTAQFGSSFALVSGCNADITAMQVKYVNATSSKGLERDHVVTRVELL